MQFWQSFQKPFTRSPNKVNEPIICFKQKFSSEIFLWKSRMQFWQSCRKSSPEARRNFVNLHFFSIRSFFLKWSSGNLDFDFDYIDDKFLPGHRKNLWPYSFFQNESRPKVFFWERRTQYSQTCWKFFSQSPEKINEPVVFSNKSVLHKCSFEII